MTGNPQVLELLEEMLDSGKTPEEVCGGCPELLPEVRERWQKFLLIDAQVGALLPGLGTPADAAAVTPVPPTAGLPQIPGYEVEAVLGHGGMGVVYKARHLRLNRTVGLKMLLAGTYASPQERARFQREAQSVASLRHANIVQVYDVGDHDGRPYFTMEFVEGGSLAQKSAGMPQQAREAAALLATLAGAVHAAHESGIVHRDLKPANVLLTADASPKVSDFGLARRLEGGAGLTQSGVPMGTPSYMAPEQARGQTRAIGPAVDVYALGAILYELLTGRPPFRGETAAETVLQVIYQEPVPPARSNAKVPRDLETICLTCLQKDPRKRYTTAADLAADLGRFLRYEPIQARPTGPVEHFWRWVRRRPAVAGMLAAVVLLVLAGGVGAWLLYQQRTADQVRQRLTDQEVLGTVERTRGLLEEGWQAHDLAKLTEAEAEGHRAVLIASSGAASAAVRQEAETFLEEAGARRGRAENTRALLEAMLDASFPLEALAFSRDEHGRATVLAGQSLDEQYAIAFRRWGLDVDGTEVAAIVARLGAEPAAVVQEVIAGLDTWMFLRRRERRPEAQWRHLYRVADQLDRNERHRRLRALLVGESMPRAESVATLVGAGPPWPALWNLARGDSWRQVQEMRRDIEVRTAPVVTVVLLSDAHLVAGDVAGAEEVLRQALALRPGQVVLLYALGNLWERQGPAGLARAVEYYRAARAQRPRLGMALSSALVGAGRADEAEEILQELMRDQQPQSPAVYMYLGTALNAQHKYSGAEAAFRKAVDLQPNSASVHYNLGVFLTRQRQYAPAEAAFRRAIDLRPDDASAYDILGNVLCDQGKFAAAEAAYRQAIDIMPDSAEAHYDLGVALSTQQKHAAAEAAYRKAIDLRPDFAQAYIGLGQTLGEQKKPAAGEAALRKAIELVPDHALAHYNLGVNLSAQGKHAAAEASYRKAIDHQPDLAWAHNGLGLTLIQQASFDEALASVKRGYDLLPATDPGREQTRRLLQQCKRYAALDARLPAVLGGTEKPARAAEQIEFARLCTLKKLHAAAARFYDDAFTAEPKFAQAVPQGALDNAARAAALAGCAQGKDSDKLDDKERARWRRRALEWLRQDLAWWGKALDNGNAQIHAQLRQRLRHWQTDDDLAGLRDPGALEVLSPDERKECLALWEEVAAVLNRAQTTK